MGFTHSWNHLWGSTWFWYQKYREPQLWNPTEMAILQYQAREWHEWSPSKNTYIPHAPDGLADLIHPNYLGAMIKPWAANPCDMLTKYSRQKPSFRCWAVDGEVKGRDIIRTWRIRIFCMWNIFLSWSGQLKFLHLDIKKQVVLHYPFNPFPQMTHWSHMVCFDKMQQTSLVSRF